MAKGKTRGNTLRNPKTVSIGEFLVNQKVITIPPNQRPYAWEEEQVEEFLTDLENTRKQNIGDDKYWHFFNMVTYVRNEENPKEIFIHDGQQRITTSFITLFYLLSKYEISNKAKLYDENVNLENITKFKNAVFTDGKRNDKLKMFSYNDLLLEEMYDCYGDKNFVKKLEKKLEANDILVESNKRIINLLKEIDKKDHIDDSIAILKRFDTLYDKFEVVGGELQDSHQAFKIFELVNNRGKSLSTIDLVKNYFYQIADNSGKKDDVTNLEQKLAKIIEQTGDHFEDIISKHWLIFFNKSDKVNYGKPSDIFKSVTNRFDAETNGKTLSNAQKRDLMFEFIDDIYDNIDKIKIIYYIFNLDYADLKTSDKPKNKLEKLEFRIDDIEKLVVHRAYVNSEFEYLDYYLYYLLFLFQKNGCRTSFKYFEEYRKAVNFYIYRSYVNSGRINLDRLNYCLGNRLSNVDFSKHGLDGVFVKFLLNEKDDGEHVDYNSKFRDKLSAPERDISNSRARILFQLMYGFNQLDLFYEEDNSNKGTFYIAEVEHILAKSCKNKSENAHDDFNLTSQNSKYKNKLEWIGNKLLMSRTKNTDVRDTFTLKIKEYAHSNYKFNKEYFVILTRVFKDNMNLSKDTILFDKCESMIDEVNQIVSNNLLEENEELMLKVEHEWRQYIAQYFYDNDLLGLKKWEGIDENITQQ